MADIKVSELTEATDTTATDKFMIVQAGASKSIKLSTLLAKLKSTLAIVIELVNTDFYVKKGATNILHVSAGSTAVGIRNSTPLQPLHVNGNIKTGETGVSGSDGVFIGSGEVLTFTGTPLTISASREISELVIDGTSTFTLGVGLNGQSKVIAVKTKSGTGPKAVISVADGITFNTITLSDVGGACNLKFIAGKWYVIGLSPSAAAISTV